ncbi:NUDIX hydrolase [Acrocarpospora macrocephala]|uniref:NUDIX hydrolase n=1 Tax=Acrocarpospora macrocephala TaxID=150177 RepID=UPI0031DF4023
MAGGRGVRHAVPRVAGDLDDDIALVRRDRPTGSHYAPPGGNVEPDEDPQDAVLHPITEQVAIGAA